MLGLQLASETIFLLFFFKIVVICECTGNSTGASERLNSTAEPRIIGGTAALPNEFPWIVLIRLADIPNGLRTRKLCSGSIINNNWIITAATCSGHSDDLYRIQAGAQAIDAPDLIAEQARRVFVKTVHPDFNPETLESNIAVWRVIPPFAFANTARVIPYAHFNFNVNGTADVAGWGGRSVNDPIGPRTLIKGTVNIMSNAACQAIYDLPANQHLGVTIGRTQVCAVGPVSDVCYGDSGGPLMCRRAGISILCGLVSGTGKCARNQLPKIYTRTTVFYDWIQVNTTW